MANLKFSKDHEWVKEEGGKAYIGISNFAQESLGDIVFVDLPKVGLEIEAGKVFAAVESVKAVSDIYAPISGKIIEVNDSLEDAPELINEDPYANWIVKLEIANPQEIEELMDEAAYDAHCQEEE